MKSIKSLIIIFSQFTIFGLFCYDSTAVRPKITVWVHGTTVSGALFGSNRKVRLTNFHDLHTNAQSRQKALALQAGDSARFPVDGFYSFSWSGKLDKKDRKQAAQVLYDALLKEYLNASIEPEITVITHSHGGSIMFHLAELNGANNNKLKIAHLILLACPVQASTKHLVGHKTFDKVYSFYSANDLIQVLALEGFIKSKRVFPDQDNLIQIKTSFQNCLPMQHIQFMMQHFFDGLPKALHKIDADYGKLKYCSVEI